MDASAPKYSTAECQAARQKAIAFIDSEPGRIALSGGIGLIPLVGLLSAWPLRGETPRLFQLAGATAILFGVFLLGFRGPTQTAE